MIPQAFITEWAGNVPWQTNEQVEQDLVICRSLIELFSDEFLSSHLAFRDGTALHKLYLRPQTRYSEDIDLVQMKVGPIKETIQHLQDRLGFLGDPSIAQKKSDTTLKFSFESEFPPVQSLRLKVETNCREHFTVMGYQQFPFEIKSSWFSGKSALITYKLEELLGTKLRALYQRRKGRDLYDLYKALTNEPDLDKQAVLHCYQEYMKFSVEKPPSSKEFLLNMEAKMHDDEFLGDIKGIIRPDEVYDPHHAYALIKSEFVEKI